MALYRKDCAAAYDGSMAIPHRWPLTAAIVSATLFAQVERPIQPLRTMPSEKLTVNAGIRDWGPATVTGTTILAGNPTNRGGLFAIDMASGKVKWTYRPAFANGTASVSTPPAVFGDMVSCLSRQRTQVLWRLCHWRPAKRCGADLTLHRTPRSQLTMGWPMFSARTEPSTRWTLPQGSSGGRRNSAPLAPPARRGRWCAATAFI